MKKLAFRQPVWPASYWKRFWLLYVTWIVLAAVISGIAVLMGRMSWVDALVFTAGHAVTGAPIFGGVGAAVTKPGRPMLFTNPLRSGQRRDR